MRPADYMFSEVAKEVCGCEDDLIEKVQKCVLAYPECERLGIKLSIPGSACGI